MKNIFIRAQYGFILVNTVLLGILIGSYKAESSTVKINLDGLYPLNSNSSLQLACNNQGKSIPIRSDQLTQSAQVPEQSGNPHFELAANKLPEEKESKEDQKSTESKESKDSKEETASIAKAYQPKKLPLFELGLGVFALRLNQYRGSNQYANYFWPLPFFIYRGKNVYAENSMVTGDLYNDSRFSLGLSLMASLRVSNANNDARSGMPSLDPTVEIGPEPTWILWRPTNRVQILKMGLPIRQAMAVEFFRAKAIGQFVVPYISWAVNPTPTTLGIYSELTLALTWATAEYHQYFYNVPTQYARSDRPAYSASGGYNGAHVTWMFSRKFNPFYTYGFIRYDRLDGAAFEDSPLVKNRHYWAMGGGFIWYFFKSSRNAENYREYK